MSDALRCFSIRSSMVAAPEDASNRDMQFQRNKIQRFDLVATFILVNLATVVATSAPSEYLTALNETAMTISIFTVITVAALALAKIARGDTHTPR